ncbi:MAG: hypothetical protein KIT56_06630 [Gammaproteobacteria bacterium]|nr:hypothetical protein [Gammaproteobacteria bacterium]MCW5583541.1 hypothetical protein [Gammaproteobacteria bacterium]
MNFNNLVNDLNFKKIAVIFLIFVAANWMIDEFIMWSYFNKFQQTMNRFNDQFNQDQARIHNKIVESEKDAGKWSKSFEQKQNEFHEAVDRGMQENLNFIRNSQSQMAEQQKEFDKKFAEMPDKMWEAHKAFANQAADAFEENGKRMDDLRTKQLEKDARKDKSRQLQNKLKNESDNRKS